MRLPKQTLIIGWGDVPAEDRFSFPNDQVLKMVQRNRQQAGLDPLTVTAEDMTSKLGVITRQYIARVDPSIGATELARIAAERAIAMVEAKDRYFDRSKIKFVISGGSSPDNLFPGAGPLLHAQLGIPNVEAYDVSAACCSGTQALINAIRSIQFGPDEYALVAIGETIGSWTNDLMTEDSFIWGDGGSAVLIKGTYGNRNFGFQAFKSRADGTQASTTLSRGIGAHPEHRDFPALNASMEGQGKKIYKWVIGPVAAALGEFLCESQIKVDNRTFLVPHNGNLRMVQEVGKTVGIPPERVLNQVARRGNQSSASVLSTLAYFADQNFFEKGDQLVFAAFGGGLIYNFIVYRWGE